MGLTDFNSNRMHTQLVGRANFRDLERYEEKERRRKWFIFLDILMVICFIFGLVTIFIAKEYIIGLIILLVGVGILLFFLLRKKGRTNFRRSYQNQRSRPRSFRRRSRRYYPKRRR